ncbi:MAG TPA: condensation domain-containing protein, partial [Tahibacter sp.]|uniref:condensation domain-containing protein n=1 Tax=Tahibacter sp. TaxID=2056211 RepID=UPI002C9877A7
MLFPATGCGSRLDARALSGLQQAVWIDQSLHPGVPLYNLGGAFRIGSDIDASLLERAINAVAAAHDALRTTMAVADDGTPRQCVLPQVDIALRRVDFSACPDGDERALAWMQHEFSRPFDPAGGLLWDTALVHAGPDHAYWLHRHHHLVSDGTSVRLLAFAVKEAYDALLAGDAPTVEAGLPLSEWLDADAAYRDSARCARDAAFWERELPQLPPPLLDRIAAPGAAAATDSRQARWSIPRALFDRLAVLAAGRGAAAQHLLLAMLSAYFARTRNLDTIVIGVAVHNRGSSRLRRALGLFASVLPLAIRVDPGETLPELAARIAADLRRCYRHQRYPVAEINRRLQPAREGRRQIFDLTFSFEDFATRFPFGAQPATALRLESGHQKTPLSLAVLDHRDGSDVVVDFSYRPDASARSEIDRLDARSARRMTRAWLSLLAQAAARPSAAIAQLQLASPAEQRLLARYGRAPADGARSPSDAPRFVHDIVADRARATPQAPAVRDSRGSWTYAEVDAAAARLAARLVAAGAGAESVVGLCVDRGVAMVVGVLGILRAGAAYLPLDPAYPAERLAYLQADSRVALVVSEQRRRDLAAAGGARVLCLDDETDAT